MMRLLHTSDWHVGANRRFPNYLDRHHDLFMEVNDLCVKHKVDVLVVSGDIFDGTRPTQEEKELLSEFVRDCPVPLAMTYGNHDFRGPDFTDTALHWLISLSKKMPKVRMWDRPTAELWNGVWWLVVPYGKWNTPSLYLITTHLLSQIPKGDDRPVVGIVHEFLDGATLDQIVPKHVLQGKAKLPKFSRIDYWALGDIHKSQKILPNAWYSGSPLQIKFNDRRLKGVLLVDIGSPPKFIPITTPTPLIELKGVPKQWPDAYIKLHCHPKKLPANMPETVVSITHPPITSSDEDIEDIHAMVSAEHLLDGLPEWLRKKGLKRLGVKRAVRMANELVLEIESQET